MDRVLDQLRERMQHLAGDDGPGQVGGPSIGMRVDHGLEAPSSIPQPVPGLVHEVISNDHAPAALLTHWSTNHLRPAHPGPARFSGAGSLLWIGPYVQPYPPVMQRRPGLLEHSLFIDSRQADQRLGAIELALGCWAVAGVIADGRGLSLTATRRLQLAARDSGALLLLVRSAHEPNQRSAAAMRWGISPSPSPTQHPRWTLELLRCKGVQPSTTCRRWVMEWNHETSMLHLPADLADRPSQAPSVPIQKRAG